MRRDKDSKKDSIDVRVGFLKAKSYALPHIDFKNIQKAANNINQLHNQYHETPVNKILHELETLANDTEQSAQEDIQNLPSYKEHPAAFAREANSIHQYNKVVSLYLKAARDAINAYKKNPEAIEQSVNDIFEKVKKDSLTILSEEELSVGKIRAPK